LQSLNRESVPNDCSQAEAWLPVMVRNLPSGRLQSLNRRAGSERPVATRCRRPGRASAGRALGPAR
jgi:hypothetical protein